ncbi:MAG: hypothetical protein Q8Q59_12155 [Luteolibacter sp.]|jgi:hypothetical protein|nr:hypothetical protein [Luteolibacter sp.]
MIMKIPACLLIVMLITHGNIPHATAHAFSQRLNEPKGEGPLRLRDHGNAIQFRNIWLIPGKKNAAP